MRPGVGRDGRAATAAAQGGLEGAWAHQQHARRRDVRLDLVRDLLRDSAELVVVQALVRVVVPNNRKFSLRRVCLHLVTDTRGRQNAMEHDCWQRRNGIINALSGTARVERRRAWPKATSSIGASASCV